MGTKPPAAVGERISKDGRHDLGVVALSSIKTSSLQRRSGGSVTSFLSSRDPRMLRKVRVHQYTSV